MVKRVLAVVILAFVGYVGYDFYRADYFNAPEREPGDFLLSYESGLKAVMRGVEDHRDS